MFKQENVILPCSSCQVKYNVTNLRAGTRFKCNKCGTVNMVPVREDTPTEFIPRANISNLPIRQSPPVRQTPAAPVASVKKSTVRLSGPSSPVVAASKPTVRTPQPQIRPSTGIRQSPVTRPSAVKRGVTAGKVISRQETEESEGIEPKKKSKTLLIIGIIGGVVLLMIVIWAMSSGDKSKDKEKKMIADAEKAAAEKAAAEKEKEKPPQTNEVTPKEPEKIPEPEKKPPKETKPPKGRLDIDEAVKTEVVPLVKDMRNQKDDEQKVTIEKITAKGKKAIPVLIEVIGDDDDRAAMYAYEILIKMTKRNRDDTTKVNPMLSREMRKDCQKEWEEWWLKNKDNIPD